MDNTTHYHQHAKVFLENHLQFASLNYNLVITEETLSTTPLDVPKLTRATTTVRTRTRTPRPPPTTIKATNDIVKVSSSRPRRPTLRPTLNATTETTTSSPSIIVAGRPHDNEIAGSSNIQHGEVPNVNVPISVDGERREAFSARLNLGAIIALGAFGGFVFLAAIITTIIILVRR